MLTAIDTASASAFLFGLVHGVGFAGALQDIDLPRNHLAVALLTFNLGVEAGQLLTVVLALGVTWLLRRQRLALRVRTPAVYVTGSVAAYWTLGRVAAIVA